MDRDDHNGYMVMKRCDDDLFSYPPLDEDSFRSLFVKICRQVQWLHNFGIAHLDIKPENIVMKTDTPHLIDFGSCFIETEAGSHLCARQDFRGTLEYAAPETRDPHFAKFDPYSADMFSLGVLLHVAVTGYFPYYSETTIPQQERPVNLNFARKWLSDSCCDLLEKLLGPAVRLEINLLFQHPWFRMDKVTRKSMTKCENM
jgi:serine/threonine protein kinase